MSRLAGMRNGARNNTGSIFVIFCIELSILDLEGRSSLGLCSFYKRHLFLHNHAPALGLYFIILLFILGFASVLLARYRSRGVRRIAMPAGLGLHRDSNSGVGERLARDPVGNTLAIVVLLGMLLSIVAIFMIPRPVTAMVWFTRPSIWIAVRCLIGMSVAGYLAYVETAQVEAVCGPVGDCNTVQQNIPRTFRDRCNLRLVPDFSSHHDLIALVIQHAWKIGAIPF